MDIIFYTKIVFKFVGNHRLTSAPAFHFLSNKIISRFFSTLCAVVVGAMLCNEAGAVGDPAAGLTEFTTVQSGLAACSSCHTVAPNSWTTSSNATTNSLSSIANSPSTINAAANAGIGASQTNATGNMVGYSAVLGTTTPSTIANDIAAYLGTFVIPTVAATQAVMVNANTTANTINLSASITVGTPVSISVTSGATVNGTVSAGTVATVAGSVVTSVTYSPTAGYAGPATFSYTVTNTGGTSSTATVNITVAPVAPNAPTIGKATVGNTQASVAFTAPANNGGAAITSYTASCGGVSKSGAASPIVVTGLSNGSAYTCTVTATNSAGTSVASAASNSVTPDPLPTATKSTVTVPMNSTSNVITPLIAGIVNTAGITISTQPLHALTPATTSGNTILYTPATGYFGSDSLKFKVSGPGGTSAATTITINVLAPLPTAVGTSISVQPNTSTSFDLMQFITGHTVTGVSIALQPAHGVVSVFGTKVTYTPNKDYFGTDTFSYLAYDAGGVTQTPATISVTITGRPDPAQDTRVTGLVNNQTAAVLHFGTAQVLNFQQRLETRHQAILHPPSLSAPTDTGIPASTTGDTAAPLGSAPAQFGSASSGQTIGSLNSWQPGKVLSYANDPNTVLHTPDSLNYGPPADPMFSTLMGIVTGLAMNSSLNLATVSNAIATKQDDEFSRLDVWAAGNLRFGTSAQGGTNTQFATNGVSVGVDKRVNNKLTVGMGFGYARDNSTVGTDGTNSKSTGNSVAGYASYMMDSGSFVDGLLGFGKVNFDTNRYVTLVNDYARASRKGDQVFGSISFGYEYRKEGVLWSPYGRYDFSYDRLDAGTEIGAGTNALSYASQNVHSSSLAFGMRGQSAHQTEYGLVQPHARLEYQHGIDVIGQTSVAYADLLATQYAVAGTSQNTHSIVVGLGSDFLLSDTLKVGVDYQHLGSNGPESYQSINFLLTKTLKGKNDLEGLLEDSYSASVTKPTGLIVAAGFAYDDNVSRASDALDKLSDTIYSLTLSKSYQRVYSKRHRLTVTGFLDTEMFKTYSGLDHFSGGMQAEYAYRADGEFGTATYGIFARATEDKANSELRDGSHRSIALNYRKSLTDRIKLFSALSENFRTGKSEVFNTHDRSARMNFDYALAEDQTIYLTGEYRRGDFASSGQSSFQMANIASWSVKDDVFTSPTFFDYRLKGKTVLWTMGYNLSCGPKDSFDFSWRRTKSTPDWNSAMAFSENYIDNQFSISYLMAF